VASHWHGKSYPFITDFLNSERENSGLTRIETDLKIYKEMQKSSDFESEV
jgi:hypothetical protein